MSHKNINKVERELLKILYAYEEILSKKNNRRTRANRTWQMVKRYGIIGAAERAVDREVEPQGYRYLIEMGMKDLTFEAIVVKYPEAFNAEVVDKASKRLKELKNISNKLL